VIILGQALGILVYTRNLELVRKARRRAERAERRSVQPELDPRDIPSVREAA